MNEIEKIKNWAIPQWHADFGDPEREIALLQDVCLFIIDKGLPYTFRIEYIEEGYLCVSIFKIGGKHYGDLQVVDVEKNKIGLFLENGDEFYIYNKEEVMQYL